MPIGPPVPANIPIVPWPEENLNPNPRSSKFKSPKLYYGVEIAYLVFS